MIDFAKIQVQRGTGESAQDHARRVRAARVTAPIFGPDVLAQPGDRAVRAEQHVLSAGVGSATTAEVVTRTPEGPTAEQRRLNVLAPALRQHVAAGLPLVAAEVLDRVAREYERTGRPVPLTREGVATALAIRADHAGVAIGALRSRGLVLERRNNFGGVAGYVPSPS